MRYALLTERYAWRSRLKAGVLPSLGKPLIEEERLTLPALLKNQTTKRGALVHHEANGDLALRQGDWVFIDSKTCGDGNKEPEGFRQTRRLHNCAGPGALYNLKTEPTQAKNLYDAQHERARAMKAQLDKLRQEERSIAH